MSTTSSPEDDAVVRKRDTAGTAARASLKRVGSHLRKASRRKKRIMRTIRTISGAIVLILMSGVLYFQITSQIPASRAPDHCYPSPGDKLPDGGHDRLGRYNHPSVPASASSEGKLGELTLLPDQITTLPMGRAMEVRALDVDYILAPNGSAEEDETASQPLPSSAATGYLRVDVSQFLRDDGARLHEKRVLAQARFV